MVKDDIIKCTVTGIKPYGIFVKIDDERNGLIHISEISSKFVSDPNDFAKIGEEIEAKVIGTTDNGDINLSIKDFTIGKKKKKRVIIETTTGFKTLNYKLPFWIDENLKKHKNSVNSIDK